eukprot:scaffold270440_cov35-Tisochrysis_lutea.AAC.1
MHKLQQPLIMTSTGSSSHRPLGTGEERGGDRQPPAAVGYGFLEQIFPLSPEAWGSKGGALEKVSSGAAPPPPGARGRQGGNGLVLGLKPFNAAQRSKRSALVRRRLLSSPPPNWSVAAGDQAALPAMGGGV